ncbi:unnamed protein product [Cochlearia groenlandica]
MTEEFEIAGTWWCSPANAATVFSGLPRPTEINLDDITNFGWQNFDNKTNYNHNDDLMNMHNSFFEGLIDPNEQVISWPISTAPTAKSEFLESFTMLDNMFLIDSEANTFLDNEIINYKSKEQTTQENKNVTSKISEKTEELEEKIEEYSERLLKRQRIETLSPLPSFKIRKEKLGDRITALQQLVSPFGKTDTASVLNEAVEYIKFLQEQVTWSRKKHNNTQEVVVVEEEEYSSRRHIDLASRGLCLMPISASYPVAAASASAADMNTCDFWNLPFSVNM